MPVGLTGVIYAAIVVAWAAYLVPMALRRHDEAARNRSIERFSSAMRVLARRGASAESGPDRVVLAPARDVDRVLLPSLAPVAVPAAVLAPRPSRRALQQAATRRRRVVTVLVLATLAAAAGAPFGLVPPWAAAVPAGFTVAFLVLARRQVRRASEAYWLEAAVLRPEPRNVVRRSAARIDATSGAASDLRRDQPAAAGADEPTVVFGTPVVAAAQLVEERVVAVPVVAADGTSLWDPVPITLPTYVDKPAAHRSLRTIDLNAAATWSSGHSEEASAVAAEAAQSPQSSPVADADEAPARAVNG